MELGTLVTKKYLPKTRKKLSYEHAIDEIRRLTRDNSNLSIKELVQSIRLFTYKSSKKNHTE